MLALKDIRKEIVTRVNAYWTVAYPTIPVYYDNAFPSDASIDTLQSFLLCSIRFNGATQLDISPTPGHRIKGAIILTAACREGTGSSKVLEYLEGLSSALKFADFNTVHTGAPEVGAPLTDKGWFSYTLRINFHVNQIV